MIGSRTEILSSIMYALEALENSKDAIQYTVEGGKVFIDVEGVKFNAAAGWCDYVHKWLEKYGDGVYLTTSELSECLGHIHRRLGWNKTYPVRAREITRVNDDLYEEFCEDMNMMKFMQSLPDEMWGYRRYAEQRWTQLHELIEYLRNEIG